MIARNKTTIKKLRFFIWIPNSRYLQCFFNDNSFKILGKVTSGGEFDLNNTPDLLPALVLFAIQFNFYFKFYNVESARYKETDRVNSVVKILKKLNIEVKEFKDGLSFYGGLKSRNNIVSGFNDHRIIMASTLLGIKKEYHITIKDIKNLEGSYPKYLDDLKKISMEF